MGVWMLCTLSPLYTECPLNYLCRVPYPCHLSCSCGAEISWWHVLQYMAYWGRVHLKVFWKAFAIHPFHFVGNLAVCAMCPFTSPSSHFCIVSSVVMKAEWCNSMAHSLMYEISSLAGSDVPLVTRHNLLQSELEFYPLLKLEGGEGVGGAHCPGAIHWCKWTQTYTPSLLHGIETSSEWAHIHLEPWSFFSISLSMVLCLPIQAVLLWHKC